MTKSNTNHARQLIEACYRGGQPRELIASHPFTEQGPGIAELKAAENNIARAVLALEQADQALVDAANEFRAAGRSEPSSFVQANGFVTKALSKTKRVRDELASGRPDYDYETE